MKFVDLSQNPPVEVTVLTLADIARQMQPGYGAHSLRSLLQNWVDDEEITTPAPDFVISEVQYWKPERVGEWHEFHAKEIEREEERKAKRLKTIYLSKADICAALLDKADYVQRRNASCYTHNRGNSMQDGRKRVLELQGMIQFVDAILGDDPWPKDQRAKLNTLVSQAKAHVKMQ